MLTASVLSVQDVGRKIKVPGEHEPYYVWYLKVCGRAVDLAEFDRHRDNDREQDEKQYERRKAQVERKIERRPQNVQHELEDVQPERERKFFR